MFKRTSVSSKKDTAVPSITMRPMWVMMVTAPTVATPTVGMRSTPCTCRLSCAPAALRMLMLFSSIRMSSGMLDEKVMLEWAAEVFITLY